MSEAVQGTDEVPDGYDEVQFGPKTLVVPSEWKIERFGDIYNQRKESIDADDGETVRYVGLEHIDSGELDINGYDENGLERSSSRGFREGDVLFGKLRPYLEKAAIAPFDGICSSDIIPIYTDNSALQRYLPYLMHSKLVQDRVISTMEGTNLPRTSWSDLESTLVPIPPRNEQRRIADILSTVDEQIQQTDEIIEKAKEVKRGMMQSSFSGSDPKNTREVRFGSNLATIPTDWEVTTLSQVCEKIVDGPHSTPNYADAGIPFVSAGDIENGEIDFENCKRISEGDDKELRPRVDPCEGDILLGKVGSGSLGKICIVDTNRRFNIFVQLALLRPRPGDIVPGYLGTALQYRQMQQQILDNASGASMQYIGTGAIGNLEIPLPTIDEQKEISKGFEHIRQKLRQERNHKSELQDLKRGLMQDLLTGKVRVTADD